MWLKQILDPRKTAATVYMLEKMIETKVWKVARGLTCDNVKCRVFGEQEETAEHLLAGCKMLAGSEYTRRHNRALVILAVQWAIEYQLIDNQTKWYRERWETGHVLESKECEVGVGLRIPFKKNNNIETTRLDVRRQTKENNLDLRHSMPTRKEH